MIEVPRFISGDNHSDDRGRICFINHLNLGQVKRFYIIEHPSMYTVRAWQGHQKEHKWFCVISGSFKIITVRPDNWQNPLRVLDLQEFILSENSTGALHIPGGYANGFKALEPDSKIIVFSDFTIEQSSGDDYRFDKNLWYNWDKV